MRIAVAPAPYKQCTSAATMSRLIAEAIRGIEPSAQIEQFILTDGGSGFRDWLTEHSCGTSRELIAERSDGVNISVLLGITDRREAIIECASIIGLGQLPDYPLRPLNFSSSGVGQLIDQSLRLGYSEIIIGCGDTANCDAGLGLASALGFRFLDRIGRPVYPVLRNISEIVDIDTTGVPPALLDTHITVVCNTNYGWSGLDGALQLFGHQKGLTDSDIHRLDADFDRLANVLRCRGHDVRQLPGAGAAGGVAGILAALVNAEIVDYRIFLRRFLDLRTLMSGMNLVVTGEGSLDRQTFKGKLPWHVAQIAQDVGAYCISIVGYSTISHRKPFDTIVSLSDRPLADRLERLATLERIAEKLQPLRELFKKYA